MLSSTVWPRPTHSNDIYTQQAMNHFLIVSKIRSGFIIRHEILIVVFFPEAFIIESIQSCKECSLHSLSSFQVI